MALANKSSPLLDNKFMQKIQKLSDAQTSDIYLSYHVNDVVQWQIITRLITDFTKNIIMSTEEAVSASHKIMIDESYKVQQQNNIVRIEELKKEFNHNLYLQFVRTQDEYKDGLAQIRNLILSGKINIALEHPIFDI